MPNHSCRSRQSLRSRRTRSIPLTAHRNSSAVICSAVPKVWVRLKSEEVLAPHQHPTASLLICTGGRGIILDQPDTIITPGDAVLVHAGSTHGFKGLGPTGIEGLSIQFEGTGLYEDTSKPRVEFRRD